MSETVDKLKSYWEKAITHKGLKKYFFNTFWLITEYILRLVVSFLIGIYVVRYLGAEKFGLFSYSLAFVSIFSVISKMGLDSIVVRELINKPDKEKELLGTAFGLKMICSIAMRSHYYWTFTTSCQRQCNATLYIHNLTGNDLSAFRSNRVFFPGKSKSQAHSNM